MRSLGEGSLSATTQVKVSSPEILLIATGQGFHLLEANIGTHVKGKCVSDMPGSKAVAGKRTVHIGTWENRSVPNGSIQESEEEMRMYDTSVVGLTHSRGVGRATPVESQITGTLEGVSSLKQRNGGCHAMH